uniref:C2H2-type domain-containing protein n=1 Tax=Sulfolobus neozealandicus TaxID=299422 RepID=Q5NDZ3_9CREN|nr:C2H2-type zinc finger protein [Sulfolobus neozealandicus]CAH89334.1 hypothetical protein [Sulfolobus neozealandicus]
MKQYVCKYCGKEFSSPQALSGHIGRVHSKKRDKEGIVIGYEDLKEAIEWLKEHYGENYKKYEGFVLLPFVIKLEKELEKHERELEELEDEEEYEESEYEDFEEEE